MCIVPCFENYHTLHLAYIGKTMDPSWEITCQGPSDCMISKLSLVTYMYFHYNNCHVCRKSSHSYRSFQINIGELSATCPVKYRCGSAYVDSVYYLMSKFLTGFSYLGLCSAISYQLNLPNLPSTQISRHNYSNTDEIQKSYNQPDQWCMMKCSINFVVLR